MGDAPAALLESPSVLAHGRRRRPEAALLSVGFTKRERGIFVDIEGVQTNEVAQNRLFRLW